MLNTWLVCRMYWVGDLVGFKICLVPLDHEVGWRFGWAGFDFLFMFFIRLVWVRLGGFLELVGLKIWFCWRYGRVGELIGLGWVGLEI